MKNRLILILTAIIGCSLSATAQQGFSRTYDYLDYPDSTRCATVTFSTHIEENLVLVSGITQTGLPGNTGVSYFAAYDLNGEPIWEKKFISSDPKFIYNRPVGFRLLEKVSTDRYVCAAQGFDISINPEYYISRPFLYYFNSNGDSLKLSHWNYDDELRLFELGGLAVDNNQNTIIGGTYYSNLASVDSNGFWLAKFDAQGDFLWKTIVFDTPFYAISTTIYDVLAGNTNNYLICGIAGEPNFNNTGNTVWSLDQDGNVQWRKAIPKTPDWAECEAIVGRWFRIIPALNGSGYYFTTIASTPAYGNSCVTIYYCGKIDNNGNMLWAKTYQRDTMHHEEAVSLVQQSNGDLLFIGTSQSFPNQLESGTSMFCTDSLGNLKWFKIDRWAVCGNVLSNQTFYDISVKNDGDIIRGGGIATQARLPCYDTMGDVSWLMLTDSAGRKDITDTIFISVDSITVTDIPVDPPVGMDPAEGVGSNWSVYPNPATTAITVYYPATVRNMEVELYDITGKLLQREALEAATLRLSLEAYTPGVYILRLMQEGRSLGVKKVVKGK